MSWGISHGLWSIGIKPRSMAHVSQTAASARFIGFTNPVQFECSLALAVERGYDVLVNSAAAQSNESCLTAALAAKLGLRSVIIGRLDAYARPVQGNLLLCHLFGAEVHLSSPDQQEQKKATVMEELRAEGHKPYEAGYGGAVYRRVAYVDGFLELWGQLRERGIRPDALYVCSGDHTQVGLIVSARALGIDLRIVGMSYSPLHGNRERARRLTVAANETAQVLGLDLHLGQEDVEVYTEFAGPAFGVVTAAAQEALHLAARTEALVLDPVYTGKTMAGLVAHIREGQFSKDQIVVFVHTGGTPSLFAYHTELGLDS